MAAARVVTEAAENNGPMIFARMGVLQAVNRRPGVRHLAEASPLGQGKAQEGRINLSFLTCPWS
jgi:hypothetical protein